MATGALPAGLRPWTAEDRAHRGRPKLFSHLPVSLIRYIRTQTFDGQEMADFMLLVLRGGPIKQAHLSKKKSFPSLRDRMEAANWLTNRAFGLPKETIELTESEDTRAARQTLIAAMSEEDRAALKAILLKAIEAQATTEAPPVPAP